jgi:hypothetical protein
MRRFLWRLGEHTVISPAFVLFCLVVAVLWLLGFEPWRGILD